MNLREVGRLSGFARSVTKTPQLEVQPLSGEEQEGGFIILSTSGLFKARNKNSITPNLCFHIQEMKCSVVGTGKAIRTQFPHIWKNIKTGLNGIFRRNLNIVFMVPK